MTSPIDHPTALTGTSPGASGVGLWWRRLADSGAWSGSLRLPGWDGLSRGLLALMVLVVLLTFLDYGISTDEEVQKIYGHKLLDFYASGMADHAAFQFKDLYLYGGLFDLISAILAPWSPLGEYETRHLLCGLLGVVGIAGAWRLARLLGGARAGFLAVLLLASSAAYFGAMFNNTKDVPFATGMIWGLYGCTRIMLQLPRPRLTTVLKLGLVVGLALGIRVGGLMVVGCLAAGIVTWLVFHATEAGWRTTTRTTLTMVWRLLPAIPVCYGLMALFWPWAALSPLNPIRALEEFSRFPIHIQTLVDGAVVWSTDPPPLYLAIYLGVKLSEPVLFGLLSAAVMLAVWLFSGAPWRAWREQRGELGLLVGKWLPVALMALVPVLIFMVLRPTIYNGMRHFMFLVPALVVIAAVAWDRLLTLIERHGRRLTLVAASLLGLAVTGQVAVMAGLHPDEYVYYNQLAGGVQGAQNRFELDYWGNALREATLKLADYVRQEHHEGPINQVYRVVVCGPQLAASYYMPPFLKVVRPTPADLSKDDFYMFFTTDRGCAKLLDGKHIITVERYGVPFAEVLDRRRGGREAQVAERPGPIR